MNQTFIYTDDPSELHLLLPALLSAVRHFARDEYAGLMLMPFGPIPSYVMDEGDSSEWWRSQEALNLKEQLWEILETSAPEGRRFGFRGGEVYPMAIGFWPEET
jgi:hypothetical protein